MEFINHGNYIKYENMVLSHVENKMVKIIIKGNQNIIIGTETLKLYVKKDIQFEIIEKEYNDDTYYFIDDEKFDIHIIGINTSDCLEQYSENICFIWKHIVCEDNNKLNSKAIEFKNKILEYFEEVNEQ